MILSVSDLKQFMVCPQLFHYGYVDRKGPAERSLSLDFGVLAHKVFENLLKNSADPVNAALAGFIEEGYPVDEDLHKMIELYRPCFAEWKPPVEWEVLWTEEDLKLQQNGYMLVGRPDAIVKWNGGYWHLQHKTLGVSVPTDVYSDLIKTDWHECVYQRMLEDVGLLPFKGTILNVFRKVSGKALKDKGLAAPFEFHYVMRPDTLVDRALMDIDRIVGLIEEQCVGAVEPVRNRAACAGPYRNHLCPFKGVCDGYTDLKDSKFVTIEPRYSVNLAEIGE